MVCQFNTVEDFESVECYLDVDLASLDSNLGDLKLHYL